MWHLTENMDEEAANANEIEFQGIKSKQPQFSRDKIQNLKFQGVNPNNLNFQDVKSKF